MHHLSSLVFLVAYLKSRLFLWQSLMERDMVTPYALLLGWLHLLHLSLPLPFLTILGEFMIIVSVICVKTLCLILYYKQD